MSICWGGEAKPAKPLSDFWLGMLFAVTTFGLVAMFIALLHVRTQEHLQEMKGDRMPIRNLEECDKALKDLAEIEIKLEREDTKLKTAVQKAETARDEATREDIAKQSSLKQDIQIWYETSGRNLTELHAGKKSLIRPFGTVGLKAGGKSLALLEGWDWDRVKDKIKSAFKNEPKLRELMVVTKEDLDKNSIKKALDQKQLAKVGLCIKQEEKFFLETHLDAFREAAA
jgi:vacuolar-type H+-ATPase subunit I/STV1